MSNMYKRKVRETLEINRFKTLSETDKTLKVLKEAKRLCHHGQLEATFPENKRPLNGSYNVRFCVSFIKTFSKLSQNITTC